MHGYRNIVYSPIDKEITLFTWNNQGERVEEHYPFKPYLYIEDPNGVDGISIYNSKLKKIEFEESFKRKNFVEANSRTFANLQPEQQFLIDKYGSLNKEDAFSIYPLKIFFLDIETDSRNGFPDIQAANDPISLISVWDSLSDGIFTFGVKKEYYTTNEKVIYKCYETEEEMLRAFVRFWRKDFPDIVSGWNSDGFDIPYLCHRINKVYKDTKACNRLSPVGRVYSQQNVHKRLADYKELFTISGITSIDYMYAYKVFTREQRASYALNAIGEEELGQGKLQYNAVSLTELAENDYNQFVDYNIQDVNLLVKLEDKLKYLSICRELAYRSLSPLISSLSTVGVVTGVAAQKALEKGKILSTFTSKVEGRYEGGFVRESQTGLHKSLLYYDANSLYPNTIVTLNISPETKLGKITARDEQKDEVHIKTVNGKEYVLSKANFDVFIKRDVVAISKSNILFSQKNRGIFPDIIEEIYAERVETKKQIKKIKSEISQLDPNDIKRKVLKRHIEQLDIRQYLIKILLNRMYGFFAEKHSPIYDIDLASSVTLTGQNCIKEAANITKNYIQKEYDLDYDSIVMGDTDSIVLTIQPILNKLNESFLINNEINPIVYNIANAINKEIDININKWASDILNSKQPTYAFKRENIAQAGIFVKKKHYILHLRDVDDEKVDKIKYTGVEVVKTSTPKKIKPLIKNAIELIIRGSVKKEIVAILQNIYDQYQKLNIEEIARPISLNNYVKYKNISNGFKMGKHTPINVKSAIFFNLLLEKYNITNKYETLKAGNKMKFIYLQPNVYNIETIGFNTVFPDEFKVELRPDMEKMFEKTVLDPIYRVLNAINIEIKNPLLQEKVDLLDIFS